MDEPPITCIIFSIYNITSHMSYYILHHCVSPHTSSHTHHTSLNVLVSVLEMASRLSYLWRVELFERFVLGKSKEERDIKLLSSIGYKRHVGRNKIILYMIIENVCIAIAPLIVMLHWHNGLIIQAGYDHRLFDLEKSTLTMFDL
jgi:hypothetical protein